MGMEKGSGLNFGPYDYNGGGGGGGGSVTEDVIVDEVVIKNNKTFNASRSDWYSALYSFSRSLPIEENFFTYSIYYTYRSSQGTGSFTITIYKRTIDTTFNAVLLSSVNLDFGVTYSSASSTRASDCMDISPNKRYVIISDIGNSKTNLHLVALTKNGEDYIFDTSFTMVDFDTTVSGNKHPKFITNDTFACISGTSLNIYKIENNAITLTKTISLDMTPTALYIVGNLAIIENSTTQIEFIDIENESVVLTETLSNNISSTVVSNNKVFVRTSYTSGNPFVVYTVSGLTVTKESFTKDSAVPNTISSNYLVKDSGNKVYFAVGTNTPSDSLRVLVFDMTNKTISLMKKGGKIISSSASYYPSIIIVSNDLFYTETESQGSITDQGRFEMIYESTPYLITYKDNVYTIGEW